MAAVENGKNVISKHNLGFPDWLDFEKLRREGMDYLGELSGNLWTDHNAHDPGITILEMLCYALLDLGYRTALPAKDLFSRNPAETGEDDNFFTPAQILGCNPLTILDYRRLLVDIKGVKNAWLTVADDINPAGICSTKGQPPPNYINIAKDPEDHCINSLNGLYHVYLDIENENEKAAVKERVKKVLLAHRNLCEDFYDITVLCKQMIGVCADIEIEARADAGNIFLQIIERLRNFISPYPRFYSLKQLLEEKKRSVEEIFAGRPFDLADSHGFVDAEEFENIILRKEIHVSDVYDIIFTIEGVKAIRNLRLQNCDGSRCAERGLSPWVFKIFENYVPEFSMECSGFHFTRNGVEINVDRKKYKEYINLNFSNQGKAASRSAGDLDLVLPEGVYREDLAAYYPLENDFPKVYGIAEGSLPSNVSAGRKAQSLQLKGYLLFFDHLLSGYLSQLKNLRHLFSFRGDEGTEHTYYINRLSDWPGLDQLLRFDLTENPSSSFGNVQAFPVSRKQLEKLIEPGKILDCEFEKALKPYSFCSAAERDIAVQQLIQDAADGSLTGEVVVTRNNCWYFYLFSSSRIFALVGHGEYKTEKDARTAFEAVIFLAAAKKNYRSYITDDKERFSFHLTRGVAGYWSYLQSLVENENLYRERRTLFLNHLLARFAETFTDYALLSYSFMQEEELQKNEIRLKGKFLAAYPELSSNRGKAYDYGINGWNNMNVSGFEKKSQAYAGMGEAMQENLCHFEVTEFEAQSMVNLALKGTDFFRSENSFDNREEARAALQQLLTGLQDRKNYTVSFSSLENKYSIKAHTGGNSFICPQPFQMADEAEAAVVQYARLFSPLPLSADIQASQFRHEIIVEKNAGAHSWQKRNPVLNREADLKIDEKVLTSFPAKKEWEPTPLDAPQEEVVLKGHPGNPTELINIKAFDLYSNRVDVRNNALVYQFTLNDTPKSFFFVSEEEFGDEASSDRALLRLLFLLTDPSNYTKEEVKKDEIYIKIINANRIVATNRIECKDMEEVNPAIDSIVAYVKDQLYTARVKTVPVQWKYTLRLGIPGTSEFDFISNKEYDNYDKAREEAARIYKPAGTFEISVNKKNLLEIKDRKHPEEIVATAVLSPGPVDTKEAEIKSGDLLTLKKSVTKISSKPDASELEKMIVPDGISRQGNFGYRLVKKDDYHAWYSFKDQLKNKAESDQAIIDIHKIYTAGLRFLELYYGGDNIREIKDAAGGASHYHFLIKSRTHLYTSIPEMVLFESIRDYESVEEAQAAFVEQYVTILTAACDPGNYGPVISFQETVADKTGTASTSRLVFIPSETMKQFGYNQEHAAEKLSLIAESYPIKCVKNTDPLFAEYFSCQGDIVPVPPDDCGCSNKEEKNVFYFTLKNDAKDTHGWISYHYFATSNEALRQFYFFLVLLSYRGNYHVTWNECDCTRRLYLREILAESGRRFPTPAAAWGKEGVEKFICTSQSENAFFNYQDEKNCCFTFKVACGNMGLIHPCTYDTPEKRDKALGKLLRASQKLYDDIKNDKLIRYWQNMVDEWDELTVKKKRQRSYCENAIDNIKEITEYLWKQENLSFALSADSATHEMNPGQIDKLKKFSVYFPIKREKPDVNRLVYKYFLDIKLPDFCEDDLKELDPCDCNQQDPDEGCGCCCTAWVSECCFDTCEEAVEYYKEVASCLANPANYYPVFDCECGPYGIRFSCHCDEPIGERHPREPKDYAYNDTPANQKTKADCCNDIIAYNPQCYTSAKMVCDAVVRAKRLINAEGLHLVEHILLRPHCKEGDCDCIVRTCDEVSMCRFTWKLPEDDPCTKDRSYCFIPGTDPFSFIATTVLPAWPERFRKKENRQLLEQLLYRETPSHIMLRILWLNPADLCRFEFLYHNWCKWLAGKPVCGNHNAPCELIDFLFRHLHPDTGRPYPFECFECMECIPCSPTVYPSDPCAGVAAVTRDPNEYVNTINELFCWPLICPPPRKRNQDFQSLQPYELAGKITEPGVPQPSEITGTDVELDAERKMDERIYQYRAAVKDIADYSGNTAAGMAWKFVNDPSGSFEDYKHSLEAIMANRKLDENTRQLNTAEKRALIQQATWYYLDNAVWNDAIESHQAEIKALFGKLKQKQLLPEYKDWKGNGLTAFKPGIPLHRIKNFFG